MSKKKKIIIFVLTGVIITLVLSFVGTVYFIGTQVVASSTQLVTNEATKNIHEKYWADTGFSYSEFAQNYKIESVKLPSSFGSHTIPADFIYSESKSNNVVVMAHGLGGNRFTNYSIAEFFLQNGYNVITYDQRSSGENTAEKTTFGYWEKYDLIDCINYAKQFTDGKKIGVWGESFGGATAIQAAAHENVQADISFLVLDCPATSMAWMVSEEMKGMDIGIPLEFMTWCGSIFNKMQLGFSYDDVECSEIAKKIKVPVLIINSEADTITPYFMGEEVYSSLASTNKELFTVKDSKHTEIFYDYNKEYCAKVMALMES